MLSKDSSAIGTRLIFPRMERPLSKFKPDVNIAGLGSKPASAISDGESAPDAVASSVEEPDVVTTVTTIGVIGVAAALFDLALIPGIIIGVAAAYAPKYVSNFGERLEPLFNYTVRGAYKATRAARSAVAEAQERMHDIAAEVEAEASEAESDGVPARAAS